VRKVQPAGHLDQQVVADLMPECVVDLAEGVHGHGGHHHGLARLKQEIDLMRYRSEVRHTGERIGSGCPPQVGEEPTSLERGGEFCGDSFEQAQIAHVEAADGAQAVVNSECAYDAAHPQQRNAHPVLGPDLDCRTPTGGDLMRNFIKRCDVCRRITLECHQVPPGMTGSIGEGEVQGASVQQHTHLLQDVIDLCAVNIERAELAHEVIELFSGALLRE